MARVALLTGFCRAAEDAVAAALAAMGHQVERGAEPLSVSDVATTSAGRLAATQPDLTMFHDPVRAFPPFTMLAASATPGPLLLLGEPHARSWASPSSRSDRRQVSQEGSHSP